MKVPAFPGFFCALQIFVAHLHVSADIYYYFIFYFLKI